MLSEARTEQPYRVRVASAEWGYHHETTPPSRALLSQLDISGGFMTQTIRIGTAGKTALNGHIGHSDDRPCGTISGNIRTAWGRAFPCQNRISTMSTRALR